MNISTVKIAEFKKTVGEYYQVNKRRLPWRETTDPYAIVVSEIMLQQTQVKRVLEKYPAFLMRFPDFSALAQASLKDVLQEWQGMGYNRRGKYLKQIAEIVTSQFQGVLPASPEIVDSFPGIGRATACSICAFAFNQSTVFIETNIRRVFIHHFFKDEQEIADEQLMPLVEAALDKENPREWYYALMDYGTYLAKVVENPNKRSRHYAVQSRFEGSDRQIRGEILRALLSSTRSRESILLSYNGQSERVARILDQMIGEGIVRENEGNVEI
ncbi:A/G-specific adenine glycosylase [Candidatus Roizmanbacteria bacterium]|nr:A/G-specific adenine glycosylase [Candidatus Roizmanbacteria bacterium]